MRVHRSLRLRHTNNLLSLVALLAGCADTGSSSPGRVDSDSGIDSGSAPGNGDGDGDGADSGDEHPLGDAGMDAGGDAGLDGGSDSGMDGSPGHDAQVDARDAASDAEADANAQGDDAGSEPDAATCDDECPYDLCAGSECAVTKIATTGSSAPDLAAIGDGVFWTEDSTVRGCTASACPRGGAAMSVPWGNHSYAAIVALRVGDADYVFVTDNQSMQGMWRAELDGDPFLSWGSADNNAAPLAAFGDVVVWGDQSKTYRASASASGATVVMNVGPGRVYPASAGPTRHTVAVDASYVYSASNSDVYKCPIGETCLTTPSPVASSALPNVVALASHGGTLYALGGSPFSATEEEKIWAVPTGGGSPTLLSAQAPGDTNQDHFYVLLADDDALYWNSYNGNIYTCARNNCEASVLVAGTGTRALAQDMSHLYWIDKTGVIYRLPKP